MAEKKCDQCGCNRKQHSAIGCVNHSWCFRTYMDKYWRE